eukprot:s5977_g5.t1
MLIPHRDGKDRQRQAAADFEKYGFMDVIVSRHRDVCNDGFGEDLRGAVHGIFLDLPAPWAAVGHILDALVPGGRLVTFSPCVEQVDKTATELRRSGRFFDVRMVETLAVNWGVRAAEAKSKKRRLPNSVGQEPLVPLKSRPVYATRAQYNCEKRSRSWEPVAELPDAHEVPHGLPAGRHAGASRRSRGLAASRDTRSAARQSAGEGLAYTTMPTRDMDQARHTRIAHCQVCVDPKGADDSPTVYPVKGQQTVRGPPKCPTAAGDASTLGAEHHQLPKIDEDSWMRDD